MEQQKKSNKIVGKLIAAGIAIVVVIIFANPKALFFLSDETKEKLDAAIKTAFRDYQPIRNANGNFDWLRIVSLIMMVAGCVAVSFLIRYLISLIHFKNKRAETIKSLVASLVKYVIAIYGVIFGLSIIGFNIGAIIASLGVLGLIIGFGAQSLIEDIITGLFIVFEGTIQVGDIITVDEYRGTVTSIGVRTLSIIDTGGNTKIINNSDVRNLVNLSSVASKAIILAPVAYETDLVQAEKVVTKLCEKLPSLYPDIFKVTPVYMGVENLNDHSVDLKIAADVDEVNIFQAKRLLNREVFLAFNEAGIEIPFMQQVVHMK